MSDFNEHMQEQGRGRPHHGPRGRRAPEGADLFEQVRRQHGGPRGRGRRGPDPFGGAGAFLGPAWGPVLGGLGRDGRRRGPRARRGDVRAAILDVLGSAEGDLNGYQVIQEISERTDGAWRPSPGSVYPTISQLEDEGLVEVGRESGRKVVRLTDAGRAHVEEDAEQLAAVWDAFIEDAEDGKSDMRHVIGQTMSAVWQVMATGTPDQQERAAAVLAETRRKIYGILADGPEDA